MNIANSIRQHWAALRALLVFTVILGVGYPLLIWLVASFPACTTRPRARSSPPAARPWAAALIGQLFTDANGQPTAAVLPEPAVGGGQRIRPDGQRRQQPRARERRRHPRRPGQAGAGASASDAGFKPSLLTQVCSQQRGRRPSSRASDGSRAVLHRRRRRRGAVGDRPARFAAATSCTRPGSSASTSRAADDQAAVPGLPTKASGSSARSSARTTRRGQIVPIRGAAPANPRCRPTPSPPAAAAWIRTSRPAYADIQVARVAKARARQPGPDTAGRWRSTAAAARSGFSASRP